MENVAGAISAISMYVRTGLSSATPNWINYQETTNFSCSLEALSYSWDQNLFLKIEVPHLLQLTHMGLAQEMIIDPFDGAKPCLLPRRSGALLMVNPELLGLSGSTELAEVSGHRQALSLRLGSRRVDKRTRERYSNSVFRI